MTHTRKYTQKIVILSLSQIQETNFENTLQGLANISQSNNGSSSISQLVSQLAMRARGLFYPPQDTPLNKYNKGEIDTDTFLKNVASILGVKETEANKNAIKEAWLSSCSYNETSYKLNRIIDTLNDSPNMYLFTSRTDPSQDKFNSTNTTLLFVSQTNPLHDARAQEEINAIIGRMGSKAAGLKIKFVSSYEKQTSSETQLAADAIKALDLDKGYIKIASMHPMITKISSLKHADFTTSKPEVKWTVKCGERADSHCNPEPIEIDSEWAARGATKYPSAQKISRDVHHDHTDGDYCSLLATATECCYIIGDVIDDWFSLDEPFPKEHNH